MTDTTQDIRWIQRFENLHSVFKRLQEAINVHQQMPDNDLIKMAVVKAFEMTFELSWKTMKDFLVYNGIDVKLPRDIIKQAFANDMIEDGQLWIDMLENRNLMTHTYDEERANEAIQHICKEYFQGLAQLHQYLLDRLA